MKINSTALAIILVILFFGGIFASNIAGLWKTESSKVVDKIKTDTSIERGNPNDVKGPIEQGDPNDIKGSFSFLDISNNFDISVNEIEKAFDIKNVSDINSFKCKDLESYYGETIDKEIGTNSVRLFIALYKNIKFEIKEETYLPEIAVKILKEKATLSSEQSEYIETHTVILGPY